MKSYTFHEIQSPNSRSVSQYFSKIGGLGGGGRLSGDNDLPNGLAHFETIWLVWARLVVTAAETDDPYANYTDPTLSAHILPGETSPFPPTLKKNLTL